VISRFCEDYLVTMSGRLRAVCLTANRIAISCLCMRSSLYRLGNRWCIYTEMKVHRQSRNSYNQGSHILARLDHHKHTGSFPSGVSMNTC
jgi:hypothetical protein